MKYCVECGYKLEDDAKFCPSCGKKQPFLDEIKSIDDNKDNQSEYNEVVGLNDGSDITTSLMNNKENNNGKASLVLGILSIVFSLLLISSPIGLILGIIGLLVSKNGKYKSLNAIGIIIFLVIAIILLIVNILGYILSL